MEISFTAKQLLPVRRITNSGDLAGLINWALNLDVLHWCQSVRTDSTHTHYTVVYSMLNHSRLGTTFSVIDSTLNASGVDTSLARPIHLLTPGRFKVFFLFFMFFKCLSVVARNRVWTGPPSFPSLPCGLTSSSSWTPWWRSPVEARPKCNVMKERTHSRLTAYGTPHSTQ